MSSEGEGDADARSRASVAEVIFRDVDATRAMADLRALNSVVFPVRYSDKFYSDCAKAGSATQVAYDAITGECVGGIACRLELDPTRDGARLYIMTLGVYAPYRQGGIGSRLLQHALNEAAKDAFIHDVYLHVQTNNYQAFDFYERFGFERGEILRNYYRRIDPPDAVVLRRDLRESWTPVELLNVTLERTADVAPA